MGEDIYTDDSSLAVAAVHAGIVAVDQLGYVRRVTILPGQDHYEGATRNDVTSQPFGPWQVASRLKPIRIRRRCIRLAGSPDASKFVSLQTL